VHALNSGDDALAAATCSYLATRLPDLKQVKAVMRDAEVTVNLVFDEPYVPQAVVRFIKPGLN
jgi:hypothetical protein